MIPTTKLEDLVAELERVAAQRKRDATLLECLLEQNRSLRGERERLRYRVEDLLRANNAITDYYRRLIEALSAPGVTFPMPIVIHLCPNCGENDATDKD